MKSPTMVTGMLMFLALHAESGDWETGGYVKYLFSRSRAPLQQESYNHLFHTRLNTKWFPTEDLKGILELRARIFYGDIVEQTPHFSAQLGHDAGFGKLGGLFWDEKKSAAYGEVDRLYLEWAPSPLQFSFGRQRIAWGTNLVWNPIDLFNPLSILDFDYVERPAVDAVRVQYYLGGVSKFELASKPGSSSTQAITAAQWTMNKWDYDFHFLGGMKADDWFAGTGWAGDIQGGGFRGELLMSKMPSILRQPESGNVSISFALSGDYTFPNSLYLHTEVLFNSEGATHDAGLTRERARVLGLLSPARYSIYQGVGFNASPLVRTDAFALFNPNDLSAAFVPSASWSASTNLDLTFLALFFYGDLPTEFGQLGSAVYLRGTWSF